MAPYGVKAKTQGKIGEVGPPVNGRPTSLLLFALCAQRESCSARQSLPRLEDTKGKCSTSFIVFKRLQKMAQSFFFNRHSRRRIGLTLA